MCGIVGVIAKNKGGLFKGHITMFGQLFWADQLRGTDGAGMFFDTHSGIKVMKIAEEASSLIATTEYDKALEDAVREGHFIIGHNRAATKGTLTWENTHPFMEKNITLVHNGTLFSHKELDSEVAVDSHAICKHMSKYGYEETLKTVDGAFALVWHDTDKKTLNMARNTERPLHIVETTTAWVICSEAGLGIWVAERNNQKVESVTQLETGHVYSFNEADLSEYSKTKVEYFVWQGAKKPVVGNWGSDDSFDVPGATGKKKKHTHHNAPVRPDNKGASNVLHLTDQRANKGQIRAWGTRVTFSPHRSGTSTGKSALSAIIWDQEKKINFLKGRIATEPMVELRYYGEWAELTHIAEWGLINGAVTSTRITKNRVIHSVSNLTQITEEAEICCSFCTVKVAKGQEKKFNGMVLCKDCCSTFNDDPQLALECGLC